jgi:apolipoprotein N-acyltransferase
MIQARLFSGFPWNFLGASQFRILPVIQIASVTGVYGISFCVAWFSLTLVGAFASLIRHPERRWNWQAELILPVLVLVPVTAIGWRMLTRSAHSGPSLKIALVQPSIPQTWIWNPKESSNRFQQLIQLSEQALTNHPDLLVWPEAAVPYMFRFDEEIYVAVTNLVRTHKAWLVLGSDDAEWRVDASGQRETNFFNSSFLVNPDGELAGAYRKRRLVIFGEYVPLIRWLPFIKYLTPIEGSFTPGERAGSFQMDQCRFSVLICFEDIFPHLARDDVGDDTDFLLNLTNNGWFGESAAQWQHAANAVFRAIENGVPLVRCANNGLTCWVDAQGRMNDVYFPGSRDIYGAGFKIAEVPLLAGGKRTPTFYRRHGDWFGWMCAGLSAVALLRSFAGPRISRPAPVSAAGAP